jgi:putative transposase
MARGFVYVVAIMDWYSRKVLAWRLSNTMDADFCVDALEEAIRRYGASDIFNTDRVPSLPAMSLQAFSRTLTSVSVWTARVVG